MCVVPPFFALYKTYIRRERFTTRDGVRRGEYLEERGGKTGSLLVSGSRQTPSRAPALALYRTTKLFRFSVTFSEAIILLFMILKIIRSLSFLLPSRKDAQKQYRYNLYN